MDYNTRKAMMLYRENMRLSQELFMIISCFEVALRNAIDQHYSQQFGKDWLLKAAGEDGVLADSKCKKTRELINATIQKMNVDYSHSKVVAAMDFGFWRYLFARDQFRVFGKSLLRIFPQKPISTATISYDNSYVFGALEKINGLRNRIAHHEPICFSHETPGCSVSYALGHYILLLNLFQWLNIKHESLLYGLDHVPRILTRIEGYEMLKANQYSP